MKALVNQKGKLERQNRAETSKNQNKRKYRESKESREEKRKSNSNISDKIKKKKIIIYYKIEDQLNLYLGLSMFIQV